MERRLIFWHYLFILFLFSGLFALFHRQQRIVRAQNATVLAVFPTETQIDLNGANSVDLQIYISNVENLNAFDITLTYDGNIANMLEWSHGGFLSNLSCYRDINELGYFSLACFQVQTPGVNGEGPLINLTFFGVSPGLTTITITEAKLPDGSSPPQPIYAQLQHGTIAVCCRTSPVTGAIALQGQTRRGGVPVTLAGGALFGQGPYTAFSTPSLGHNLDFGLAAHDTYALAAAYPGYLGLAAEVTVSGPLTLPPLRLLAGDVTGDGTIGPSDLDAIRAAYGMSGAGLAADLNGDGLVNLRDLALAGGNYGLSAASAYADWQP